MDGGPLFDPYMDETGQVHLPDEGGGPLSPRLFQVDPATPEQREHKVSEIYPEVPAEALRLAAPQDFAGAGKIGFRESVRDNIRNFREYIPFLRTFTQSKELYDLWSSLDRIQKANDGEYTYATPDEENRDLLKLVETHNQAVELSTRGKTIMGQAADIVFGMVPYAAEIAIARKTRLSSKMGFAASAPFGFGQAEGWKAARHVVQKRLREAAVHRTLTPFARRKMMEEALVYTVAGAKKAAGASLAARVAFEAGSAAPVAFWMSPGMIADRIEQQVVENINTTPEGRPFLDSPIDYKKAVYRGVADSFIEVAFENSGYLVDDFLAGKMKPILAGPVADFISRNAGAGGRLGGSKRMMAAGLTGLSKLVNSGVFKRFSDATGMNSMAGEVFEEWAGGVARSTMNLDSGDEVDSQGDPLPWHIRVFRSAAAPFYKPEEYASMAVAFSVLPFSNAALRAATGRASVRAMEEAELRFARYMRRDQNNPILTVTPEEHEELVNALTEYVGQGGDQTLWSYAFRNWFQKLTPGGGTRDFAQYGLGSPSEITLKMLGFSDHSAYEAWRRETLTDAAKQHPTEPKAQQRQVRSAVARMLADRMDVAVIDAMIQPQVERMLSRGEMVPVSRAMLQTSYEAPMGVAFDPTKHGLWAEPHRGGKAPRFITADQFVAKPELMEDFVKRFPDGAQQEEARKWASEYGVFPSPQVYDKRGVMVRDPEAVEMLEFLPLEDQKQYILRGIVSTQKQVSGIGQDNLKLYRLLDAARTQLQEGGYDLEVSAMPVGLRTAGDKLEFTRAESWFDHDQKKLFVALSPSLPAAAAFHEVLEPLTRAKTDSTAPLLEGLFRTFADAVITSHEETREPGTKRLAGSVMRMLKDIDRMSPRAKREALQDIFSDFAVRYIHGRSVDPSSAYFAPESEQQIRWGMFERVQDMFPDEIDQMMGAYLGLIAGPEVRQQLIESGSLAVDVDLSKSATLKILEVSKLITPEQAVKLAQVKLKTVKPGKRVKRYSKLTAAALQRMVQTSSMGAVPPAATMLETLVSEKSLVPSGIESFEATGTNGQKVTLELREGVWYGLSEGEDKEKERLVTVKALNRLWAARVAGQEKKEDEMPASFEAVTPGGEKVRVYKQDIEEYGEAWFYEDASGKSKALRGGEESARKAWATVMVKKPEAEKPAAVKPAEKPPVAKPSKVAGPFKRGDKVKVKQPDGSFRGATFWSEDTEGALVSYPESPGSADLEDWKDVFDAATGKPAYEVFAEKAGVPVVNFGEANRRATAAPASLTPVPVATFEIVKLAFGQKAPEGVFDGHRAGVKNVTNAEPGAPGALGNPYVSKDAGGKYSREEATQLFEEAFLDRVNKDAAYKAWVLSLRGKKVGYYKPTEKSIHLHAVQKWLVLQEVSDSLVEMWDGSKTTTPAPVPVAPAPAPAKPEAGRVVAVIGTAGRDKTKPMSKETWTKMLEDARSRVRATDVLVSGGAAWADHLAVALFLEGRVAGLRLRLPAPLTAKGFEGEQGTAGGAANYYHGLFSATLGKNTIAEISAAIKKGAEVSYEPAGPGYSAMFARNAKVAAEATSVLAYTFGDGALPVDGGTKNTWDKSKAGEKIHVPIHKIGVTPAPKAEPAPAPAPAAPAPKTFAEVVTPKTLKTAQELVKDSKPAEPERVQRSDDDKDSDRPDANWDAHLMAELTDRKVAMALGFTSNEEFDKLMELSANPVFRAAATEVLELAPEKRVAGVVALLSAERLGDETVDNPEFRRQLVATAADKKVLDTLAYYLLHRLDSTRLVPLRLSGSRKGEVSFKPAVTFNSRYVRAWTAKALERLQSDKEFEKRMRNLARSRDMAGMSELAEAVGLPGVFTKIIDSRQQFGFARDLSDLLEYMQNYTSGLFNTMLNDESSLVWARLLQAYMFHRYAPGPHKYRFFQHSILNKLDMAKLTKYMRDNATDPQAINQAAMVRNFLVPVYSFRDSDGLTQTTLMNNSRSTELAGDFGFATGLVMDGDRVGQSVERDMLNSRDMNAASFDSYKASGDRYWMIPIQFGANDRLQAFEVPRLTDPKLLELARSILADTGKTWRDISAMADDTSRPAEERVLLRVIAFARAAPEKAGRLFGVSGISKALTGTPAEQLSRMLDQLEAGKTDEATKQLKWKVHQGLYQVWLVAEAYKASWFEFWPKGTFAWEWMKKRAEQLSTPLFRALAAKGDMASVLAITNEVFVGEVGKALGRLKSQFDYTDGATIYVDVKRKEAMSRERGYYPGFLSGPENESVFPMKTLVPAANVSGGTVIMKHAVFSLSELATTQGGVFKAMYDLFAAMPEDAVPRMLSIAGSSLKKGAKRELPDGTKVDAAITLPFKVTGNTLQVTKTAEEFAREIRGKALMLPAREIGLIMDPRQPAWSHPSRGPKQTPAFSIGGENSDIRQLHAQAFADLYSTAEADEILERIDRTPPADLVKEFGRLELKKGEFGVDLSAPDAARFLPYRTQPLPEYLVPEFLGVLLGRHFRHMGIGHQNLAKTTVAPHAPVYRILDPSGKVLWEPPAWHVAESTVRRVKIENGEVVGTEEVGPDAEGSTEVQWASSQTNTKGVRKPITLTAEGDSVAQKYRFAAGLILAHTQMVPDGYRSGFSDMINLLEVEKDRAGFEALVNQVNSQLVTHGRTPSSIRQAVDVLDMVKASKFLYLTAITVTDKDFTIHGGLTRDQRVPTSSPALTQWGRNIGPMGDKLAVGWTNAMSWSEGFQESAAGLDRDIDSSKQWVYELKGSVITIRQASKVDGVLKRRIAGVVKQATVARDKKSPTAIRNRTLALLQSIASTSPQYFRDASMKMDAEAPEYKKLAAFHTKENSDLPLGDWAAFGVDRFLGHGGFKALEVIAFKTRVWYSLPTMFNGALRNAKTFKPIDYVVQFNEPVVVDPTGKKDTSVALQLVLPEDPLGASEVRRLMNDLLQMAVDNAKVKLAATLGMSSSSAADILTSLMFFSPVNRPGATREEVIAYLYKVVAVMNNDLQQNKLMNGDMLFKKAPAHFQADIAAFSVVPYLPVRFASLHSMKMNQFPIGPWHGNFKNPFTEFNSLDPSKPGSKNREALKKIHDPLAQVTEAYRTLGDVLNVLTDPMISTNDYLTAVIATENRGILDKTFTGVVYGETFKAITKALDIQARMNFKKTILRSNLVFSQALKDARKLAAKRGMTSAARTEAALELEERRYLEHYAALWIKAARGTLDITKAALEKIRYQGSSDLPMSKERMAWLDKLQDLWTKLHENPDTYALSEALMPDPDGHGLYLDPSAGSAMSTDPGLYPAAVLASVGKLSEKDLLTLMKWALLEWGVSRSRRTASGGSLFPILAPEFERRYSTPAKREAVDDMRTLATAAGMAPPLDSEASRIEKSTGGMAFHQYAEDLVFKMASSLMPPEDQLEWIAIEAQEARRKWLGTGYAKVNKLLNFDNLIPKRLVWSPAATRLRTALTSIKEVVLVNQIDENRSMRIPWLDSPEDKLIEKAVFGLEEDRIPLIDPKTGKQAIKVDKETGSVKLQWDFKKLYTPQEVVDEVNREWDTDITTHDLYRWARELRLLENASRKDYNDKIRPLQDRPREEHISFWEGYTMHDIDVEATEKLNNISLRSNAKLGDQGGAPRLSEATARAKAREYSTILEAMRDGYVMRSQDAVVLAQRWFETTSKELYRRTIMTLMTAVSDSSGLPTILMVPRMDALGLGKESGDEPRMVSQTAAAAQLHALVAFLRKAGVKDPKTGFAPTIQAGVSAWRQLKELLDKDGWADVLESRYGMKRVVPTNVLGELNTSLSYVLVRRGAAHQLAKKLFDHGFVDQPGFVGKLAKSVYWFNRFTKEATLSVSFFHIFAEMESWISTFGLKGVLTGKWIWHPRYGLLGMRRMYKEMRENPERFEQWYGFAMDQGTRYLDSEGRPLMRLLNQAQDIADQTGFGKYTVGKGVKVLRTFKEFSDKLLWEMVVPTFRMQASEMLFDELREDPRYRGYSDADLINDISQRMADDFGGQDLNRMLWATPKVRDFMRILMFAPDWTLSVLRQAGIPEVVENLFGVKLLNAQMKTRFKNDFFTRYWPAYFFIIMLIVPNIFQAMLMTLAKFFDPDDDEELSEEEKKRLEMIRRRLYPTFAFQNAPENMLHVNVTPIYNWLSSDPPRGTSGARQIYAVPGKQLVENIRLFQNPLYYLSAKSSVSVKMTLEQVLSKNSAWHDMPWVPSQMYDKAPPMGGLLEGAGPGAGEFWAGRLGSLIRYAVPSAFHSQLMKNEYYRRPSFPALPLKFGMSKYEARKQLVNIVEAYADEGTWQGITTNNITKNGLTALSQELADNLALNGYDPEPLFKQVFSSAARIRYMRMAEALEKGDEREANRMMLQIKRLERREGDMIRAIERRFEEKRFGGKLSSEERAALQKMWRST